MYYKDIDKHIEEMKRLYNILEEKPEWISMEEIEELYSKMKNYNKNLRENVIGVEGINGVDIKVGLDDEKTKEVLDSVIGQMSDGIWENSSSMERFWKTLV